MGSLPSGLEILAVTLARFTTALPMPGLHLCLTSAPRPAPPLSRPADRVFVVAAEDLYCLGAVGGREELARGGHRTPFLVHEFELDLDARPRLALRPGIGDERVFA